MDKIEGYPVKSGKVRDVYDIGGNKLIIVATDRISAFDWVLPDLIPDKGKILTRLSVFWMDLLGYENHLISDKLYDMPAAFRKPDLDGRTMMVKKCEVIPFEAIVRGYLAGSGWSEYSQSGMICGIDLPEGLRQNMQFPKPIFTPSTKEESGHDQNISFREMKARCEEADSVRTMSINAYSEAVDYAWRRGIIIADTKFEWGKLPDGELCMIDEALTPDSSRFWPLDGYNLDNGMPSFDKQFVRDYLTSTGWDKNSPPPRLPDKIIEKTRDKYLEAFYRITGRDLEK